MTDAARRMPDLLLVFLLLALFALGLAALFAGREEGAEEDDSTFRLDSIASAVSGFCLVVGPLTGFLLGHLLIGAVASLIGLGVGLGGGAVWAVVRSRAA